MTWWWLALSPREPNVFGAREISLFKNTMRAADLLEDPTVDAHRLCYPRSLYPNAADLPQRSSEIPIWENLPR